MRRPRLNVLRTFEAAGRKLSFSGAATELNISQAAVSQQIHYLEAYLGEALFLRHHRRISLTGTGQAYFDTVNEALDRLDTVTDQLFPDRPNQVVTIRCTSSVATLLLAPHMRTFQSKHPDIDLRIRTLDTEGQAGHSRNADLEIFISGKTNHEAQVKPLLNCVITPVAAPEYLENRRPTSPRDILDFDLIHILGYEDDWYRWFRNNRLETVDVPRGLTVDSSLFAIDATIRGDGIYLGRRPFINGHLKSGKLVEVFKLPHHLHATYYLRQSKNKKNSRNKDRVAKWLMSLSG
jgi:LysR family transcriptional regulator, glycine cleavage system transcriptional activator